MLSIVDRYVSKEFLKYFVSSLIVFTTLFLAVDMLTRVWQLKTDSLTIWSYYLYSLPTIIHQMIPVSCLMATIFTISVLSRTNELVALFSAGMSLARVTAPVLVLAAAISVASFLISDTLIPPFTKKKNYVEFVQIKKNPSLYYTVKTNKIWYRSKDLIYNIKIFIPEKNLVQGLTVYFFDPQWRLVQLITAESAEYSGSNWHLKNGTVTLFAGETSFPLTQTFKDKMITLEERPSDIQDIDHNQDIMTVKELRRYIRKNKEAALDTTRYEVVYHSRFAFSFVCFVMAFLGIPFSVSRDRSGGFAMNIGICLAVVFAYWTLVSIGMSLGMHGTLTPVFAAWGPNALMLFVAVYFLLRLKK